MDIIIDGQTMLTLLAVVSSVATVVWKISQLKNDLSTRLAIVETEVRFLTGNNKRNEDLK